MTTRRLIALTLAFYLAARGFSAILFAQLAHHQDPVGIPNGVADGTHAGYFDIIRMWDGEWYRQIATTGYPDHVPMQGGDRAQQSVLAFYPLYPLIIKAVMAVTHGGFALVGGTLSLVFGCVAAVLMVVSLRPKVGGLGAFGATATYASSPPSPSLQAAYTESLAMVFLIAALMAVERRRWVTFATLTLALGVTRPIALPLLVVGIAAVYVRVRQVRAEGDTLTRGEKLRMTLSLALCALAGSAWTLITWALTGQRNAYTLTMSAWRDGHPIEPFVSWFAVSNELFIRPIGPVLVVVLVLGMTVWLAGAWGSRLGVVLRVWCAAYCAYLFATLQPWSSLLRYLLELYPLAATMVLAAGRYRRRRYIILATCFWVSLNLVLQVAWVWGFWRFVPPLGNPP